MKILFRLFYCGGSHDEWKVSDSGQPAQNCVAAIHRSPGDQPRCLVSETASFRIDRAAERYAGFGRSNQT